MSKSLVKSLASAVERPSFSSSRELRKYDDSRDRALCLNTDDLQSCLLFLRQCDKGAGLGSCFNNQLKDADTTKAVQWINLATENHSASVVRNVANAVKWKRNKVPRKVVSKSQNTSNLGEVVSWLEQVVAICNQMEKTKADGALNMKRFNTIPSITSLITVAQNKNVSNAITQINNSRGAAAGAAFKDDETRLYAHKDESELLLTAAKQDYEISKNEDKKGYVSTQDVDILIPMEEGEKKWTALDSADVKKLLENSGMKEALVKVFDICNANPAILNPTYFFVGDEYSKEPKNEYNIARAKLSLKVNSVIENKCRSPYAIVESLGPLVMGMNANNITRFGLPTGMLGSMRIVLQRNPAQSGGANNELVYDKVAPVFESRWAELNNALKTDYKLETFAMEEVMKTKLDKLKKTEQELHDIIGAMTRLKSEFDNGTNEQNLQVGKHSLVGDSLYTKLRRLQEKKQERVVKLSLKLENGLVQLANSVANITIRPSV